METSKHKSFLNWSLCSGIVISTEGILILLGPTTYFPIETKAFNNSDHMAEVARQIETWIAAAKLETEKA